MAATMTLSFKCLVLSYAFAAVLGFTGVRDDASWFKNGQRIKNRFVTGVVNGIVDFDCVDDSNGGNVEGECLSKIECTKSGGKTGALCSFLGSCCVIEKTCDATTSSKVSYFVPPKTFQKTCPLTVNIYNKNVCQIRLDFEEFEIAQPTTREINEEGQQPYLTSYQCNDDEFTVVGAKKNLGFTHLCGRNKGQHIYVPVGEDQQNIKLFFKFADRPGQNLVQPTWKIKIRQLECRKSGNDHLFNAPSKLMAMYNNLKSKKNNKSDWELIAPPNCLQYYYNNTGTFESFNYNEGNGSYIGNLDYAICFKKTADICGAKYKAQGIFQMNFNEGVVEQQKCHPKEPASREKSQDYIRIPGGFLSGNNYKDYFCNQDFNNDQIVGTKSNEPLFVGVHTDAFFVQLTSNKTEIGFRIKYDLETGRCDTPF